ncbi:MAG: type II/IV secretion system protein [Phycisphaeraceae bacterium]|nr:type II/IV secretion system protein [Phycisphaeraceae bacterium]
MLNQQDFAVAMLLEEKLVTQDQVDRATRHGAERQMSTMDALIALGTIKPNDAAIARAAVCECPFVDLAHFDISIANAALLPRSVAEKQLVFPLFNLGKTVTVGMADPLDLRGVDRVRSLLKTDIEPVLCEPGALKQLIERAYSMTGGAAAMESAAAQGEAALTGDEPIVAAVNQIIIQAIDQSASDIHLGPDEHHLHLRYRIDGSLVPRQGPPLAAHPGLVQRLKVMANLDLTQTRRPQDGKFRFQHGGKAVDIRLSTIPTVTGENVVMRLLASAAKLGTLQQLGFPNEMASRLEHMLEHPHGMMLVTGPTGSGKTTSLYSFISRLNTPDRHVVTIEDPVEIRLPLVRQVQVNTEIGMTFAGALRSILRQDPDVILVGEIRDEETARIAVQSALTGHLVLSTLHTNDAPGAIARLKDFNCPAFAINASVLCVLAQRLVRRVCDDCAKPYTPEPALLRRFAAGHADGQFRRGSGCPRCLNSGTRGRLGIYELVELTPNVQLAIEQGASTATLRTLALREGMKPMWQDGLDKARLGVTTLEEVAAVATIADIEVTPDNAAPKDSMRLSA